MSLIKNIGIGKEYFNPFSFLKCQEEGFTSIAEAYDWFSQMQDHNLIPNTAEVTLDTTLWRYNLLDVRLKPKQNNWLFFNFIDHSVIAHKEKQDSLLHLKELYPDALLIDDKNVIEYIHKYDHNFYTNQVYLFYPGEVLNKLKSSFYEEILRCADESLT